MPFTARLVGTYLIFFIGSQMIYYGTKLNGGNHTRSPVWNLVKWFHDIMTYGSLAMLVAALVMFIVIPVIMELISQRIVKAEKEVADKRALEVSEARRHDYKKHQQEEIVRKELEIKRIEEDRKIKEKKNKKLSKPETSDQPALLLVRGLMIFFKVKGAMCN